jgi:hypothetical protein
MRYTFFFFLLSICSLAQKPLDSLRQNKTQLDGLFTSYLSENGKLFFELSETDLHKDLLMITRLAATPEDASLHGDKTMTILMEFRKKRDRIELVYKPNESIANFDAPILKSVQKNNTAPILFTFEILNEEPNKYFIDVTPYFNDNSPGFGLKSKGKVLKKNSAIDRVKVFQKNLEISQILTFSEKANEVPRTFLINHSIIELPDDKMDIRYADHRVGYFTVNKIDYSSKALKADQFEIIQRWHLVPKDIEAYNRGELVEPIEPIVFYIDPATPYRFRSFIKKGVEDWNEAFEAAGFKNAILSKDPPTAEEDPDFSTEDVRYSIIKYIASTTRNAKGPRVYDPRTGQIIESDVFWYHNHIRSYRNRYLLETGAANPRARTINTPLEDIGEMLRQVIAHEVGHSLGLRHNFKASSVYPVDSLRSAYFTKELGLASSIMDYARYNYVAQPGDEGVRFIRKIGPYDIHAIAWAYRYFDDKSPDEVREIQKKWMDNRSENPHYMFGGGRESGISDPHAMTEIIGDDVVRATNYGLKNLKIVASHLDDWVISEGSNYDELNELFDELFGVYRRYIGHLTGVIGGVHQTLRNENQEGYTYKNTDRDYQIRALSTLKNEIWTPPLWLIDKDLVSHFKPTGSLDQLSKIQYLTVNRLINRGLLERMSSQHISLVGNGLSPSELMDHLYRDLFLDLDNSHVIVRNLQKYVVEHSIQLMEDDLSSVEVKGLMLNFQKKLNSYFSKKSKNPEVKAHNRYCMFLLEKHTS